MDNSNVINNNGAKNLNYENFIESQNNCPLCGTKLEIHVDSYLQNFTVKEEAFCPSCQTKTRVKDHRMH